MFFWKKKLRIHQGFNLEEKSRSPQKYQTSAKCWKLQTAFCLPQGCALWKFRFSRCMMSGFVVTHPPCWLDVIQSDTLCTLDVGSLANFGELQEQIPEGTRDTRLHGMSIGFSSSQFRARISLHQSANLNSLYLFIDFQTWLSRLKYASELAWHH